MAFATQCSWFPKSKAKDEGKTLNFVTATKKIMLVSAIPDGDEEFVSELTEISTSGYTGGYGGSGRKTMSGTFAYTADTSVLTDLHYDLTYNTTVQWATLGAGGDTFAGWVILTETGGADTTSIPWLWIPIADAGFALNGVTETLTLPNPILKNTVAA